MAKLVLMENGYFKGEFELKPGVNKVGRGPGNDIQIPSGSISTSHCELTFDPAAETLAIKDLGSTNGSFIDGQRVQGAMIANNQLLRLGDVELRCEITAELSKPRIRAHAVPTPPPIPQPAGAAPQPTKSAAGMCQNHPQAAATLICKKCNGVFCSACVNSQWIVNRKVLFCRACGDECIPITQYFAEQNVVEKTFFQQLPGAFAFPFKGDGVMLIIAGTIFFAVLGFVQRYTFFYSLMLSVFGVGYLFAYAQSILTGAGIGEQKPPAYPDFSDYLDDIVRPFLLLTGSILFCFAPVLLFLAFSDEGLPWRFEISIALTVGGILYLPMSILAVGMHNTLFALNPLLIVVSIIQVPLEYVVVCVLVGVIYVCNLLSHLLGFLPVIGWLVGGFLSLYFFMVEMRILGLLFYSKKRELGWKVC